MNRSKAKGTAAESAVRDEALGRGFAAVRVAQAGTADHGDVWIAHGRVVVEVKAGDAAHTASLNQIRAWYAEANTEAARVPQADMAVLVVKRKGTQQAREWRAFTSLADYAHVMGRGEPYPLWAADGRVIELTYGDLLDDLGAVL